jgi:hypothetical protein
VALGEPPPIFFRHKQSNQASKTNKLQIMGGGKRRHTAKTGDKALKKGTSSSDKNNDKEIRQERRRKDADEDPVYDVVDRFHNNEKGYVALDPKNDDDDASLEEEAVMDLAAGGDDSSSSSSSAAAEDHSDEGSIGSSPSADDDLEEDEDDPPVDDDDMENDVILDEEEEEAVNIRDWGQKKSAYYNGDVTTDLSVDQRKKGRHGQEEEGAAEDDAFDEEEAAQEVQRERFQKMTDEDFMISSDSEAEDQPEAITTETKQKSSHPIGETSPGKKATKEQASSSKRERLKKLDREHPEVLPLLSHFADVAKDLQSTTMVATRAILEGEPGTAKVCALRCNKVICFFRIHDRPRQKDSCPFDVKAEK